MDVDFKSCPGAMIISMIKYINAMLEEWPEALKGTKVTPRGEHLFKNRPDDERELHKHGIPSGGESRLTGSSGRTPDIYLISVISILTS